MSDGVGPLFISAGVRDGGIVGAAITGKNGNGGTVVICDSTPVRAGGIITRGGATTRKIEAGAGAVIPPPLPMIGPLILPAIGPFVMARDGAGVGVGGSGVCNPKEVKWKVIIFVLTLLVMLHSFAKLGVVGAAKVPEQATS